MIRENGEIEIGYTVIEDYQGCGYATQALELALKLAKISSKNICVRIRDDNLASQKVAQKCGAIRTDIITELDRPAGIIKLRKYIFE